MSANDDVEEAALVVAVESGCEEQGSVDDDADCTGDDDDGNEWGDDDDGGREDEDEEDEDEQCQGVDETTTIVPFARPPAAKRAKRSADASGRDEHYRLCAICKQSSQDVFSGALGNLLFVCCFAIPPEASLET